MVVVVIATMMIMMMFKLMMMMTVRNECFSCEKPITKEMTDT